jgi:N-hydroxyarylamine O-acetyltransferase
MNQQATLAYLARIGIHEGVEVSPEGLAHLHLQHLRTVPFENLSRFLDEPVALNPAHLWDKLVTRRRGGFCYEVNAAFSCLLDSLGFDVSLLSAQVFDGAALSPPHDHLLLLVHFDQGDYLADVGFGDSFLLPLPLTGAACYQAGTGYRLVDRQDRLVLERSKDRQPWRQQYRFDLAPQDIAVFADRCAYHRLSPESRFTQNLICSLARPDGRISLSGTRLIITLGADRLEQPIADAATLRQCLHKHFGIELSGEQAARLFSAAAESTPVRRG